MSYKVWPMLYSYQQKAVNKLIDIPKALLGFEAGMGKTITSLAWLESHNKHSNISMNWIVCAKTKIPEWETDIIKIGFNKPILLTKSLIKNTKIVQESQYDNPIYIIGYQAFANLFKAKTSIPPHPNQLMIFDESQKLNGDNSNISKSVIKLVESNILSYVLLLSGTLHNTGFQDLANQAVILGISSNKYSFANSFIESVEHKVGGIKVKFIRGYKNTSELISKFNNAGVLLKSKGILPQREHVEYKIDVEKSPEYDILKTHQVLDFYMAPNKATKQQGLRMLSSNFISKRKDIKKYTPFKQKTLQSLLMLPELNDSRIIIFYNWDQEFKDIQEVCEKLNRPFSYINGKGHDKTIFESHSNGVIIIQYASGAEAIDGLQISNQIVYYAPMWSGGLFEQSKHRVDRIGQKNTTCYFYYLISKNTIEVDMYKNYEKFKNQDKKMFENN